jgi:hypothetical protein
MIEHVELLQEHGLPVPEASGDPRVIIQNAPEVSAA